MTNPQNICHILFKIKLDDIGFKTYNKEITRNIDIFSADCLLSAGPKMYEAMREEIKDYQPGMIITRRDNANVRH